MTNNNIIIIKINKLKKLGVNYGGMLGHVGGMLGFTKRRKKVPPPLIELAILMHKLRQVYCIGRKILPILNWF